MSRRKGSCYRCGDKATSKEHVPPQCFFPEAKDIDSLYPSLSSIIDLNCFRVNLITVPACYKHNGKKSKDDEFLMACIAPIVGNNALGYIQTKTKVKRIYDLNGDNFINVTCRNPKDHIWHSEGINYPVILGNPYGERMVEALESIAYALYYHEFKSVFEGTCTTFLSFLKYPEDKYEKKKILLMKRWKYEPKQALKGANPEVFQYQFGERDSLGFRMLKMTFYEGTDIFVGFFKEKVIPKSFNVLNELIEAGIKTTVTFPDGDVILNE